MASAAFRIPAGGVILSDPVDSSVPAFADLAFDVFCTRRPWQWLVADYVPQRSESDQLLFSHRQSRRRTGVPGCSDHAVLVPAVASGSVAAARRGAVAAFGDSITDGTRSTPDTNNRWPDHLARRLASQGGGFAVMNVAIAGNRVLSEGVAPVGFGGNAGINALARFDRDVLALPGVTHVIVMEGINDIGTSGQNGIWRRPTT
jgi:hypothetical protein